MCRETWYAVPGEYKLGAKFSGADISLICRSTAIAHPEDAHRVPSHFLSMILQAGLMASSMHVTFCSGWRHVWRRRAPEHL
jgi:hypothetical protein